jgi:hypothetical protein
MTKEDSADFLWAFATLHSPSPTQPRFSTAPFRFLVGECIVFPSPDVHPLSLQ